MTFSLCAGEAVALQDIVGESQSTTARTFSMPRTVNCRRSQLRQRAWMHSQIERGS
jgi:hypothetical protein